MQKIPTIFERNERGRVTPVVRPECEWVINGRGVATRKFDGTAVLIKDNGSAWTRREVRPGTAKPAEFITAEVDQATGRIYGWEPRRYSPFAKYIEEAITRRDRDLTAGTYELCGPRMNGNPEGFDYHVLIKHARAERYPDLDHPAQFDEPFYWIRSIVLSLPWEGIVWHHPDGRMAKIKGRDFR